MFLHTSEKLLILAGAAEKYTISLPDAKERKKKYEQQEQKKTSEQNN